MERVNYFRAVLFFIAENTGKYYRGCQIQKNKYLYVWHHQPRDSKSFFENNCMQCEQFINSVVTGVDSLSEELDY